MSQSTTSSDYIRSSYLKHLFDVELRTEVIKRLQNAIVESGVNFNAIAFRGWSGALIAPELAALLRCGLVGVRKDLIKEPSHGYEVEGLLKVSLRYIIVDDFISSGTTIKAIIKAINAEANHCIVPDPITHTPVAVFLHRELPIKSTDYRNHASKVKTYPWGQLTYTEFGNVELPVYNCGLDRFLCYP